MPTKPFREISDKDKMGIALAGLAYGYKALDFLAFRMKNGKRSSKFASATLGSLGRYVGHFSEGYNRKEEAGRNYDYERQVFIQYPENKGPSERTKEIRYHLLSISTTIGILKGIKEVDKRLQKEKVTQPVKKKRRTLAEFFETKNAVSARETNDINSEEMALALEELAEEITEIVQNTELQGEDTFPETEEIAENTEVPDEPTDKEPGPEEKPTKPFIYDRKKVDLALKYLELCRIFLWEALKDKKMAKKQIYFKIDPNLTRMVSLGMAQSVARTLTNENQVVGFDTAIEEEGPKAHVNATGIIQEAISNEHQKAREIGLKSLDRLPQASYHPHPKSDSNGLKKSRFFPS